MSWATSPLTTKTRQCALGRLGYRGGEDITEATKVRNLSRKDRNNRTSVATLEKTSSLHTGRRTPDALVLRITNRREGDASASQTAKANAGVRRATETVDAAGTRGAVEAAIRQRRHDEGPKSPEGRDRPHQRP